MKHTFGKRALALALSLALCLGLFPAQALAAGDGTLYFAVSDGETLVVPPEKLSYTAGMTIKEVLLASDHTFDGLGETEEWIRSVDGVIANYVRSDEQGGYDLNAPADSVEMFCLDVREGFLTPGLQALVRAMADLMEEEADVRAAADAAYQAALESYPTAGSDRALALAADIIDAVEDYKAALEKTAPITFTTEDGTPYGGEVTAENQYGRVFADDDGDGTLELPWGETYAFTIRRDFARVDGSVRVTGAQTITADLPTGDWMAGGARLSLSGGRDFEDSVLELTQEGHTLTAQVPDTYATGSVYLCAQYDPELFSGAGPKLYACYTNTDGKVISPETDKAASNQTWNSKYTSTTGALSAGSAGAEIVYRVAVENGTHGYTYAQEYTLVLERSLSLSGIRVTDQEGTGQAPTVSFDPETREYTYRVLDTVTAVNILPTAFRKNYTVRVNGTLLSDLSPIPLTGDSTTVTVTLEQGEATGEYTLTFVRAKGQNITFTTVDSGTELQVYNQNGEELKTYRELDTGGGWVYRYTLVPGETYHYVASKGEFYHTARTFTLEEASGTSARISVPTADALTALSLGQEATLNSPYPLKEAVAPGTHRYTLTVGDRNAALFVKAAGTAGMTVQALYTSIAATAAFHGKARTVTVPNGGSRGQSLANALLGNAQGNEITLRFSREEDGITQYQDYVIQVERALSLGDLQAECGGITCRLEPAYSPAVTEYEVTVPMAAASLDVTALLREGVSLPFG
ncbi:MAG: cadherin-like beta sandwich domain-containing protein, partial [Clostridiaceae bacterium]|nr:cadherin-like beta sandwich domain-containing protein [Clostridiaceae bacterium]